MKLDKIRKVCIKDKHICIYDGTPTENMVMQWIGCRNAMYPVRGIKLDYQMIGVLWELGDDLDYMIEDYTEMEKEMMMAPGEIDENSAPNNVVAIINGWLVLGAENGSEDTLGGMFETNTAWCVDMALLKPCEDGKKRLHVLPVVGKNMAVVYSGGTLAGVIRTAPHDVCAAIVNVCAKVGVMEPVEG